MKRIYLSSPHMGGKELELINQAFATNWVAPAGPNLDGFEKQLSSYVNVPFCAAVSSGTAAIHLALIILGIERGDEVICSSFTFAGSCNPIVYQGAIPVFLDSELDTWNMDPEALESCIKDRLAKGKRPKAIIAVHLYGMPAKMDQIMEVAARFDIPVIEDAAEGLGSSYKNQKLGGFGTLGIFSFNGNKIITTSGGGALVATKPEWIKKAKFLATQARDEAPHYQHSHIGYNYRLSNISAAIGMGQMEVLDVRVQQRRTVFQRYFQALKKYPFLSFQPELEHSFSNRWLTCITIDPSQTHITPERIRLALEKVNIESRPLWKPMHLQPVFRNSPYYGNHVAEQLFNRGLCLPSGSNMSVEDQELVIGEIEKSMNSI